MHLTENKILHLHGLESGINNEKKKFMEQFGEVIFPKINYKDIPDAVNYILEKYKYNKPSLISGSSFGGFVAYYYSLIENIPCLAFNPALPYRSLEQNIPDISHHRKAPLYVFIGGTDDIIKASDNINFILNNASGNKVKIVTDFATGHRIPLNVFCNTYSEFINYLNRNE